MIRRAITGFAIVMLLIACSKKIDIDNDLFQSSDTLQPVTKKLVMTTIMDKNSVPGGTEVKDAIWDKGLDEGMDSLLNEFVREARLFRLYYNDEESLVKTLIRKEVTENPAQSADTGDYSQEYEFIADFLPTEQFVGVIKSMGKGRDIGGAGDEVFIEFVSEERLEAPSYFLIGSTSPFESDEISLKVFGSGKLNQVTGNQGLGEILETNKEVYLGDIVVLLQVSGRTTGKQLEAEALAEQEEEVEQGPDEVVVEPQWEPEPVEIPEPEEMK